MSSPTLPPDLITEILSWLPVKLLVRFTSVSKLWKSLIFHPTFVKLHLQRSPKNTHVLLTLLDLLSETQTWLATPYSVRHLLEHSSTSSVVDEDECRLLNSLPIGSINGLVCLIGKKSQEDGGGTEIRIRFWNPSLRLRSKKSPCLTVMPNVGGLWTRVHLGFGYDVSAGSYKVVAVFWDDTVQKREGRVYSMGDSCWRKILACPDFPILLGKILVGPFVNGCVNWLALHNLNCHKYEWENVTIEQLVIFSLDLQKETGKYMLLPVGIGEVPQDEPTLGVLRGCLCLYYDHLRTHFVLWEMREFGVQESWTRLVNVSYVHLQFDGFVTRVLLVPVCLSENGDVMLLANKERCEVIMYNRRDDRVENIQLPNNNIWYADEHMQS